MKLSNSYPYPVLYFENNDYRDSNFYVEYATQESFDELKINVLFVLENLGIQNLIECQKAVYMVHVECQQTSFRKSYLTNETEFNFNVNLNELRGKVNIHSFVIAQCSINNYTNPLLDDWYTGVTVNYEKGNFIAIGNAIELTLNEENTDLLDLPSIVDIHRAENNEYMEVDMFSDNIIITLPSYEYDFYAYNANSMFKNSILNMVIFPSLIYVFSKLKESKEEIEEFTWYQVMEKLFKENNCRFDDIGTDNLPALKAAQLILRKPIKSGFLEIEKINRMED
jgi:hypothetical protein